MTDRGIIFDLGWTLVDFTEDIPDATARRARDVGWFLGQNGFDLDGAAVFAGYYEELQRLRKASAGLNYEYPARLAMLRALRRYVGRQDAARLAADVLAASFECIVPGWKLYPDTLDTLTVLRDAGYRLGCISNTNDGAHVWRIVDRCSLRPWLSPIYMSDELGFRKPHPCVFNKVLNDWGMLPEQVIMVGDTLNADVLGAHSVGMRGIWIDRGPTNPWSENEASQAYITPDATIGQLAELPELLNRL